MDNKNYILTHWVETEIGEQLKFAVSPSEENINDNVNVVDEIRDEIMNYLNDIINEASDKSVISTTLKTRMAIKEIFNNY